MYKPLLEMHVLASEPPLDSQPTHNYICNRQYFTVYIYLLFAVGGAEKVRKYWANFIQDTDVLVFVVDSADESRLAEAYTEVHILLGDERLKNAPIVLLANKQVKFISQLIFGVFIWHGIF